MPRVTHFEVSRCARISSSPAEPPVLVFVAQTSNPDGFVVNRREPRGLGAASMPIPLMTWPPCCPGSVLVLWPKQQTVMLGFVEQPRNPTIF
jgi:hypothetical protein